MKRQWIQIPVSTVVSYTGLDQGGAIHNMHTDVVVAPPALYLIPVLETIRSEVKVAAQNCYYKNPRAFTGEIRYIC